MSVPAIGPAVDRVDGHRKVTGAATYSAEWRLPGLAYAYMVESTIARGRVASIESDEARAQTGVIAILTADNAPKVAQQPQNANDRFLTVLQDDVVRHDRQPVALVIAETFEQAKEAASLRRTPCAATPKARSPFRRYASTTRIPRRSNITTRWSRTPPSRSGTATS